MSPRHRVTATYHDDGACGAEVYGNIYHKAGSLPVLIGGGHNNHYRHNIFIDSPVAIHIDARMQGWGKFMIEKGAIIDQRLQTVNYKILLTVRPILCSLHIGTMTLLIQKAM